MFCVLGLSPNLSVYQLLRKSSSSVRSIHLIFIRRMGIHKARSRVSCFRMRLDVRERVEVSALMMCLQGP